MSSMAFIGCGDDDGTTPGVDAGRRDSGPGGDVDGGGGGVDSGGGGVDSGGGDVDSGGIDIDAGGPSAECVEWCTCMVATCGSDAVECATECPTLGEAALSCRIEHCHNAERGMTDMHCGHARGESLCM